MALAIFEFNIKVVVFENHISFNKARLIDQSVVFIFIECTFTSLHLMKCYCNLICLSGASLFIFGIILPANIQKLLCREQQISFKTSQQLKGTFRAHIRDPLHSLENISMCLFLFLIWFLCSFNCWTSRMIAWVPWSTKMKFALTKLAKAFLLNRHFSKIGGETKHFLVETKIWKYIGSQCGNEI